MNKLTLKDIDDVEYENARVLLRVDFNVPMDKGEVQDDSRIVKSLTSLNYILERKPKVVMIVSHLGRPKGKIVEKFSLKPVCKKFEELTKLKTEFVDIYDAKIQEISKTCEPKTIIFCENIRFYPEEESKDQDSEEVIKFRKHLSSLCDIFVCDAFACAHRAHSSIVGVKTKFNAAGFLMKAELDYFGKLLKSPDKPYLAILGGAKVDTKIGLIMNLLDVVDEMIIIGGMAYTFKKVLEGMKIGKSLFDEKGATIVGSIKEKAEKKGVKLHFPEDWVCGNDFKNDCEIKYCKQEGGIPDDFEGMDIGKISVEKMQKVVKNAKTIIWNGPAGVFEFDNFSKGSVGIMDAIIETTEKGATSIICGVVVKFGKEKKFSHISTGGGASLELCEGKNLPGFGALDKFKKN